MLLPRVANGRGSAGGGLSLRVRPRALFAAPHRLHSDCRRGRRLRRDLGSNRRGSCALVDTPEEVPISIRGGDNACRQINDLLPAGSPVHRLLLVEVYTPSGNWSSYPGHKHDVHRVDAQGNLLEADLEEVYFYQLDKPEGYAYQRVYTDEDSPLQKAGYPIDALICATHNTAVLVPEGYHPVVSAPGYTTYYLNVLAGSAQSLANQDDPRYAWVKTSYSG